jgi:hypothetical protein
MLPIYAARDQDFEGDFAKVKCAACRAVTPGALLSSAAKVLDLKGRLRCGGSGREGRAVVSIAWGRGATGGTVFGPLSPPLNLGRISTPAQAGIVPQSLLRLRRCGPGRCAGAGL